MTDAELRDTIRAAMGGELGILCTGEEFLRVTSFSSDSDAIVRLTGRFQDYDEPMPRDLSEVHTPATDRTATTSDFTLGRGYLKALSVVASSGAPTYAQTFIRVDLVRGKGSVATVLQTLIQGPVTAVTRRGWPGSPIIASIEGPGIMRSITGTDPAANVEIAETVPTGARWRVQGISFPFVTDANVANREVAITFDDGTTVYHTAVSGVNQAASLTRRYSFARGGIRGAAATAAEITGALPDLWLPAGHRIMTATTNRQATDNFGAPQLLVEEHLEAA